MDDYERVYRCSEVPEARRAYIPQEVKDRVRQSPQRMAAALAIVFALTIPLYIICIVHFESHIDRVGVILVLSGVALTCALRIVGVGRDTDAILRYVRDLERAASANPHFVGFHSSKGLERCEIRRADVSCPCTTEH